MDINTLGDLITRTVIVLVSLCGVWVGFYVKKYVKNDTTLNQLIKFAQMAVVIAQKSGIDKDLTGNEQFQQAVNNVEKWLNEKGITDVDIELIKSAVEREYVRLNDSLNNAYSTEDTKNAITALKKAKATLAETQSRQLETRRVANRVEKVLYSTQKK